MRKLTFIGFVAALVLSAAALPGLASARSSSWTSDANKVCVIWLAKAKKEFAVPVKPSGLLKFAIASRTLETQELAALEKIPNASPAGTHALVAVRADIAEISTAIDAGNRGDSATFVKILKQYLNDHRAKAAFTAAGASQCG